MQSHTKILFKKQKNCMKQNT